MSSRDKSALGALGSSIGSEIEYQSMPANESSSAAFHLRRLINEGRMWGIRLVLQYGREKCRLDERRGGGARH